MYKFVNKTTGRVFVNECQIESGEMSPWYMNANETFSCQSDLGTLIVKVSAYGVKTIKKEGKLSATFEDMAVKLYEDET